MQHLEMDRYEVLDPNVATSAKVDLGHSFIRRLYDRSMSSLTAFVLAGGQSTRMGTDKALLELDGKPLIQRSVALARSVAQEVKIVGDPAKYSRFGEVIGDIFPAHGPLGGIHAALSSSLTEWNLVIGVDMPFLNAKFLNWLVALSHQSEADVIVPEANGHLQPLCAMYSKGFAAIAEHALQEGRNKIDALFSRVHAQTVLEEEILRSGFDLSIFRNLNTPQEWTAARGDSDESSRFIMSDPND